MMRPVALGSADKAAPAAELDARLEPGMRAGRSPGPHPCHRVVVRRLGGGRAVAPAGEVLSSVVPLPGRHPRAVRRRGARGGQPGARGADERRGARGARPSAACGVDDLGGVAVTVGPGLIGALLVGVQTAKAIAWSTTAASLPGQPSPRPSGRRLAGGSAGASSHGHPGGLRRAHHAGRGRRPDDLQAAGPDPGRRRRRGVRQGRAAARAWAIRGDGSSTSWPRGETRGVLASRWD